MLDRLVKECGQLDENTRQTKPLSLPPKMQFLGWALILGGPERKFFALVCRYKCVLL